MNEPSQSEERIDGTRSAALPLSLTELSERCMGSAAVATLVLDKFEEQLTADVETIQECLAAGDVEQIARVAHALKGAAGAVAASTLRDLAAEIERLARKEEIESITRELASLRSEVDRCLAYLPAARTEFACVTDHGPAESGAAP